MKNRPFPAGSVKRMKGLEPSTFCMANASDRSRPFAQTSCLQPFQSERANKTEPERTPNLAILATDLAAKPGLDDLRRNPPRAIAGRRYGRMLRAPFWP